MKSWIRLTAGVVALSCGLAIAHAEDQATTLPSVPVTRDLASDAALAMKARMPLLLVFMQDHCDYCDKLEREVLNPNYATGAFDGKVMVRRFMIDDFAAVTGFNGKRMEASTLASELKVYATPTLLLVDAHGHELAQRIVGIDNPDFFAAYLDESIAAARANLPVD